jgi:hypothetical protein
MMGSEWERVVKRERERERERDSERAGNVIGKVT